MTEMIDGDVFSDFWTIACDVWSDREDATANFYRQQLSQEMDTDLFRAAATSLLRSEEFWPPVDAFVREARKVRRRRASRNGKVIALRKARRRKRELEREAREMFRDHELDAREVGRLVAEGEIDVAERMGEVLPPGREVIYRSAGRRLAAGEEGADE